ncbi:MAG: DUF4924 family protein [Flavobacteriales bacterium]|nr:DUF4924 family protein [Flavobacteriales bacterium]
MTVAQNKFSNNIIEYVLFMWQMEDLARAADFNPDVYASLLGEGRTEEDRRDEMEWFEGLCSTMKNESCVISGHIQELERLVAELQQLHYNLLRVIEDKQYQQTYVSVYPSLQEFQKHMTEDGKSDVESLLTGLYGLLVLKLKGKEVSGPTQKAMDEFSQLLGLLAAHYRRRKDSESNINLN